MRNPSLFAIAVFLAACASPTAVIDERAITCEPGQAIGVAAGFEDGTEAGQFGQLAFLVEVANNSHDEITVLSVRVEPSQRNRVRFESSFDGTKVTIPEGEAHLYRLPTRMITSLDADSSARVFAGRNSFEFFATVSLSNGDHYHCRFVADLR